MQLFPDPDPGEIIADLASEGHVGAELSARAFRGTQAQGEAGEALGPFMAQDGLPEGEWPDEFTLTLLKDKLIRSEVPLSEAAYAFNLFGAEASKRGYVLEVMELPFQFKTEYRFTRKP